MKVGIEEISPVKKAVTVEIPQEVVTQEVNSAYVDLNRRVRVPGFRPGKAPRSILQKRYSQTVKEDVIRKLVPDYCNRAIKEAAIDPVDLPSIDDIQMKEDAPMTFKATVEVRPSFTLQDYQDLKISMESVTLKDSDLDRAVQELREKHATLEPYPADRKVEDKDFVFIDFKGTIDGKPFERGTGEGIMVQVGSQSLVSDFEQQLIGHQAGEDFKVQVVVPKDYHKKEFADKEATFDVKVREVKKRILPELDDEFAKDLGEYSSMKDLKDKIRERLEDQIKKERERSRRKALMSQLVQNHSFEVPDSMVEREMRTMLSQLQSNLPKGLTVQQAGIDPKFVQEQLEPAAREKVKGWLILDAIADREGLQVSQADLEEALDKMASETKLAVEDLRRMIFSREGSLDGLSHRLRQDKAMDKVDGKTDYSSS